MGSFADIVNKAIGAATNNGNGGGTTLDDFLNHFSDSSGAWVNQIDPINTFDVTMKFHPDQYDAQNTAGQKQTGAMSSFGQSLLSSAKSSVKNFANNITGGLLGSIMGNKTKITDRRDNFEQRGQETFMEYLAAANMLVGKEDWIGESGGESVRPLEIRFGVYCQSVTIPSISMKSTGMAETYFGSFPLNSHVVEPDTHEFQMSILNTKVPIHERIIYPWMREVSLHYWSYQCQPYTTADITVDFTKHCDMKYVFYGCRPIKIFAPTARQVNGDVTRDITFAFDYMIVTSKLQVVDTASQKLLQGGKTLFNGVTNMLNM